MSNDLTRRSFVKWGTAAAGAATLAGFTGCAAPSQETLSGTGEKGADNAPAEEKGVWLTGACSNNCSCNSSRCLLKVYVEEGVPLKIKTDEDEDSPEIPQRRACPRGRARVSYVTSPSRIKYPMKRKGWSPDNPNGEMRGKDEWEKISWEEALDIIADQMKKTYDAHGARSILTLAYGDAMNHVFFDPVVCLINELGGAVSPTMGTVSMGAWPLPEMFMTGSMMAGAPDSLSFEKCDLHVHFGNNWSANKGGNAAYQLHNAQAQGGKLIIIDPWLNQTAQTIADEWIPVIPGTDTALCLGIMYHQIENGLYDQEYLDKYCVGFDVEHMPEGADPKDNFKDYVLGTYDNEPKTPEWAEAICGVEAALIKSLAEEIGNAKNVDFFAGQSTTKIPAGEMFAQAFYTLAFMHGGLGSGNTFASWVGLQEGMSGVPYVMAGNRADAYGLNPINPLEPPAMYVTPDWSQITDDSSWEKIEYSECWQSILDGAYGRDTWPGGKRPLNIRHIYTGGNQNALSSLPNTNAGIEVFRKADFVWGANPYFDVSRQYCDVLLPIATSWEQGEFAYTASSDTVYWADKVIEPLFESKPEGYVAEELAKRLGVAPEKVNTMTPGQRTYESLAGAAYMKDFGNGEYAPLITITQEDIDALGVEGKPQEGVMSCDDFKSKGLFKTERSRGDKLSAVAYAGFFADPEANPLATQTGKFEIYCPALSDYINSMGFTTLSPIPKWQIADKEQGPGCQTSEYPLLLWTPHSLRRAHTCNDSVVSLREAFPQECFMSPVDASERGIENGDIVLVSSPHGKVLRPAKVMPTMVPGAVALQDGAWIRIDEETGIDLGGNPNILQAPKASGHATQSYTGTLVQVEKYTGSLTLEPDKNTPVVTPVGIEE